MTAAASPTMALPRYRVSYLVAPLFAVTIAGLEVDAVVNTRLVVDASLLFEAGLLVGGGMANVGELADVAELVDGAELVVVAVTINSLSWPAVTV
jgi:Na+/H+ antiporter NhaA